jgi:hypothetical protein
MLYKLFEITQLTCRKTFIFQRFSQTIRDVTGCLLNHFPFRFLFSPLLLMLLFTKKFGEETNHLLDKHNRLLRFKP